MQISSHDDVPFRCRPHLMFADYYCSRCRCYFIHTVAHIANRINGHYSRALHSLNGYEFYAEQRIFIIKTRSIKIEEIFEQWQDNVLEWKWMKNLIINGAFYSMRMYETLVYPMGNKKNVSIWHNSTPKWRNDKIKGKNCKNVYIKTNT